MTDDGEPIASTKEAAAAICRQVRRGGATKPPNLLASVLARD